MAVLNRANPLFPRLYTRFCAACAAPYALVGPWHRVPSLPTAGQGGLGG